MEKIGVIRTVASQIPKEYQVIRVEGRMFAGKDAFLFPNNREDLRCVECLLIPQEWEWAERYVEAEPDYGVARGDEPGKYAVIKGVEAREAVEGILSRHETGALTLFDEPYPYTVPLNHVYRAGNLYMHSGKRGKKLSLLLRNPRACYMLYGTTEPVPERVRSCHLPYESLILYGEVRLVEDPAEKERALRDLTNHYGTPYQHGFADQVEVLAFAIHHGTARTGRFKPAYQRKLFYFRPAWDLS